MKIGLCGLKVRKNLKKNFSRFYKDDNLKKKSRIAIFLEIYHIDTIPYCIFNNGNSTANFDVNYYD